MKCILVMSALLMAALTATAQTSSTIQNSYCYTGLPVECDTIVYQNLVDPAGTLLIVFFTGAPSNQGSFTVYETSGTPAAPTSFTPTIAWGYFAGIWSASFTDPAGRRFLIDFQKVNSARFGGPVWAMVASSRIVGPSMLSK